ncbi:IS256 family transposase [Flexivirga alba]|uniref:IS256 family transposase n=1 Tax=Flexivirga alba TaxID=702742 RepID=A0ABW2AIE3_9MICO
MTVTKKPKKDEQDLEPEARKLGRALFSEDFVDEMVSRSREQGVPLTGKDGLIGELLKATLERGMDVELTDHLGYDKHERRPEGTTNARNGTTPKTVATEVGDVTVDQPRDRAGSFASALVPKHARQLGGLADMIISLYAGGMTIRDIRHHLVSTIGADLSHDTISNLTDAIGEEVKAWQSRPLEPFYPVIYLDALMINIRDGGHVSRRAAHVAVGVDIDGVKHVLGIWIQAAEGAKFWAGVCAQLANRGVKDVLIICCDGLSGLPEAIQAQWPHSVVQTCTVHLIRASMRFVAYGDYKAFTKALKPIYTAADEAAAKAALDELAASPLGAKYPAAVATWTSAWERFTPFLDFGPAVRRVIYTTNAIESLNYQLRKIIKNRGQFPSDDAAIKLLWLAIRNIEDKRDRERAKQAGRGAKRQSVPRLVEGAVVTNWKQAINELFLSYPDRVEPYLN